MNPVIVSADVSLLTLIVIQVGSGGIPAADPDAEPREASNNNSCASTHQRIHRESTRVR